MNENRKVFYQNVMALVIPMALQNLINVGVTAADVFMLGKLGETSLSGASLAGQVQFIMTLAFFGLTSGATILTAQYWGKKDLHTIEKVMGMALRYSLMVASVFTVVALIMPGTLLRVFTKDAAVIAEGIPYLRIVSLSYGVMAFSQIYLSILRSMEKVRIATVVYVTSLLVNVGINAVLIFGLFGAPKLGIVGAAIGTLIARVVELSIALYYEKHYNALAKLRLSCILETDSLLRQDFFRYSIPVVFNEMLWGLGTSANTAIIGHMGSAGVAANSVAQVARQLATVVAFGICSAAAIYLGKTIGENRFEDAKIYGKRFIHLSFLTGILGGGLILLVGPFINQGMSLSDKAHHDLAFMFLVMSYFVIGQAINTTLVVGVFRSGGDTKYGLFLDMTTMWAGSILMGFVAANIFHAPIEVVYVLLMSDEIIKLPFTLHHFYSYSWLKNVTRDFEE